MSKAILQRSLFMFVCVFSISGIEHTAYQTSYLKQKMKRRKSSPLYEVRKHEGNKSWGFPGGSVVKTMPVNAGD